MLVPGEDEGFVLEQLAVRRVGNTESRVQELARTRGLEVGEELTLTGLNPPSEVLAVRFCLHVKLIDLLTLLNSCLA